MSTTKESADDVRVQRLPALLQLARAGFAAAAGEGRLELAPVLEAAAAVLETERVGFWRYEGERIRCEHLFLRSVGRHVKAGSELPVLVGPRPFEALPDTRILEAKEAARDAQTRETLAPYLVHHGITIVLQAPVRVAGKVVGMVSHEHVGEGPKSFSADDVLVATSVAGLVALVLESWSRQPADDRLAHASLHDPLTDLPNRRLFLERVDRSLRGLERRTGLAAVLSIGIDGVPATDDGRSRADDVLLAVAKAITGVLRPSDLPARLDRDGFGVLIDHLDEPWEAIAVAERLLQALARPVRTTGGPSLPTASVGIALCDGSRATAATELLREAEAARAHAAQRGGGCYEVFESTLRRDVLERMSLGWALRDALPAGQFVLEFQPEYSLPARRLLGVEALLRWDRPGHGRIPAEAFMGLAESTGLIVPIGTWVLREACRRVQSWRQDRRAANLGLRVNLSARQFERPDVVETVAAALETSSLPPAALGLEITETVLMGNAPAALATLTALKALGVGLAIDDFGIGYSSLAYLKRFPVDTLKIDRSFVEGLGTDPIDLPIVQAVMSLGKTLGLAVVAEGVDRLLQEQTLKALGCERVQGFLYSPGLPADELPSLFGSP